MEKKEKIDDLKNDEKKDLDNEKPIEIIEEKEETIEISKEWFRRLLHLSLEAANAGLKEVDNTKYSPFWHQYFPTLQGYIGSVEHLL